MGAHSKEKLIPDNARLAAKRGFIRTASQSLAGSFLALGGTTLTLTRDVFLALGIALIGAIFTALIAGCSAYFDLLYKGIPEEYASTIDPEPTGRLTD